MKIILALLLSGLPGSSTFAQPAALFPVRVLLVQQKPVAARCDISACRTTCYVEQSHCNTRDSGACSSRAQMCVQACTSQCQ